MQNSRAVQPDPLHKHDVRGDHIMKQPEEKYAAEYHFGNTIVRVVAPETTPEKVKQAIYDMHMAGWAIVNELIEKGEEV